VSAESNARAEASRLKAIMGRWGVRCSIELQAGRNGAWIVPKYLRMHHHTATRPSQGATPALGIVKTGRPDVPGPLANGYGGYDLVFRIITMGLANHPGQGGPIIIDGVVVPRDSMRSPSFGVEWEGGYEEWTPRFLEFMGRADNALAEWMRRPDTSQLEHKTWAPTRKIDRYKFTRERGIGLTRMWSDQEEEEDMDVNELVRAADDGEPYAERLQKQADQGAGQAIARQASTDGSALRKALREISGAEAVTAVDNVLRMHAADGNSALRQAVQAEVAEALTPVTAALDALREAVEDLSS
jgi:hypothetical protein